MGLYLRNVKSLVDGFHTTFDFRSTLTVGRHFLFAEARDVVRLFEEVGKGQHFTQARIDEFLRGDNFYADNLFRLLGAEVLDSTDYSDYEGATIVHDMNDPMHPRHHNKYSMVCDFGTLEHIFNAPVAIKNYMNLVKENGHLLIMTVCNNQPGHGFYQFSPEFFFRVLSEENGFAVERVVLQEAFEGGRAYEVKDPVEIRNRVCFTGWAEMEITAVARKVRHVDVLNKNPQQSDYTVLWGGGKLNYTHHAKPSLKMRAAKWLSTRFPRLMHRYYSYRCQPGRQRHVYRRVD